MKVLLILCCFLFGFYPLMDTLSPLARSIQPDPYLEIQTVLDSSGVPEGYKAYLNTPICEDDKCYQVELNFYWDLLGRFEKFDTLPGKGLTKLDHIPFTRADYQKMDRLLKDADSPLANYSKEELVRDTRSSEIDGLTGATILEIKDIVISGGVYSCYTLWHIAHGSVVDSLQAQTRASFDTALVEKLVGLQDQEVNYFLINHFSEEAFSQYLPQLLKTFAIGQGYFVKNAIEKMPVKVLNHSLVQAYFVVHFETLNYFTQVALLKKLRGELLSLSFVDCLQKALDTRNSAKNSLIRELLKDWEDQKKN